MDNRILVVEDDINSAKMLESSLKHAGYQVSVAGNGEEAVEVYRENPFPIVITDLEMPRMGGNELIDKLNEAEDPPIIFVTTAHHSPELIIEIMKKGAYDYIIKPIDINELNMRVKRAFETAKLRRANTIMEKEKVIRLENQLEWYHWQERATSRDNLSSNETIFTSLQTSFNQGAGFGALLVLINMISQTAEKSGDKYIIDANLYDMVKENAQMSGKALETFGVIQHLISKDIQLRQSSATEVKKMLQEIVRETKPFAERSGTNVILSDTGIREESSLVEINENYLQRALTEALMNAYKFSKKKTDIIVLMKVVDGYLNITFINTPTKDELNREGIPMEYENLVFEPFFRLRKSIKEEYKTLDFGLGLTLLEKIIARHGGKTSINNITDHMDLTRDPVLRVSMTITIPTAEQ